MSRKGDLRRMAVIDAFCSILLDEGIDMPSMDRVGILAGANRQSLRYHFGSKEALVKAGFNAIVSAWQQDFEDFLLGLGETCTDEDLIPFLIPSAEDEGAAMISLINIITTAAQTDDRARDLMLALFGGMEEVLIRAIRETRPKAALTSVREVAFSLLALSQGSTTLSYIGLEGRRQRHARKVAKTMLRDLGKAKNAVAVSELIAVHSGLGQEPDRSQEQ